MAIVHFAMFDSINAIVGGYRSHTSIHPAPAASMDAAIVQSAHDTLVALFPSQAPTFNLLLAHDLSHIPPGPGNTKAKAFTFTSDEFNGVTKDHNGVVRPLAPRSFSSLSQAEDENGQSRIHLGIH